MSKPEQPILLSSLTLHRRAFDDPNAKQTQCGIFIADPEKDSIADLGKTRATGAFTILFKADEGQHTQRLCKRCFY